MHIINYPSPDYVHHDTVSSLMKYAAEILKLERL